MTKAGPLACVPEARSGDGENGSRRLEAAVIVSGDGMLARVNHTTGDW